MAGENGKPRQDHGSPGRGSESPKLMLSSVILAAVLPESRKQ
jgi:hypothetical protein